MNLVELAARAQKGDERAFSELVSATTPQLFRLAARVVGSFEDAQDVLQLSYVRAAAALPGARFESAEKVMGWLRRLVVHKAIDALRKKRHWVSSESENDARSYAVEPYLEARSALRALSQLLQELPESQRAVLVLKEIEGMTSSEIASLLNMSEGAVEQRLVRARATLKQRVKYE